MYKNGLAQRLVNIRYSKMFVLLYLCGSILAFLKLRVHSPLTFGFGSFKTFSIVNLHLIQLDVLYLLSHQTIQKIYFGTRSNRTIYLKIPELPYDPAIPLLGIQTEETRIERDTCTPMFIAALFIIARTWKQPRCPSADEWIRQLWYIHTMEYYSAKIGRASCRERV